MIAESRAICVAFWFLSGPGHIPEGLNLLQEIPILPLSLHLKIFDSGH
jgi:hypothetical protein